MTRSLSRFRCWPNIQRGGNFHVKTSTLRTTFVDLIALFWIPILKNWKICTKEVNPPGTLLADVKLFPWSRVFDVITQKDKKETRNVTWITIVFYNKKRTMSARVVHSYSNKSAPNPLCLVITDIINVPHCTVPLSDGTTSQTQMSLFGSVIVGLTNEMITYLCDWFLRCDTTVLKWVLCESHCSWIRPWGREEEKYGVPGQEKGKDWHAF